MQPARETKRLLIIVTMLVMLIAVGCGSDNGDSADTTSTSGSEASGDDDTTDDGGSTGPTGDARGTLEIDGVVQDLSLEPGDYSQCNIEDSGVGVYGMVTADGTEVTAAGATVWGASITPGDGPVWEAASDDPDIDSDATLEYSAGTAVIEGTWGTFDGSGQTAQIRVELICP